MCRCDTRPDHRAFSALVGALMARLRRDHTSSHASLATSSMGKPQMNKHGTSGLVAMTSASHAEGRQFDPGLVYFVAQPMHRLKSLYVPCGLTSNWANYFKLPYRYSAYHGSTTHTAGNYLLGPHICPHKLEGLKSDCAVIISALHGTRQRAHPDLNQGPADLQSAALTTELCTR